MKAVQNLSRAVVEFVIGDDWRIALGVAIALGVTALLAESGLAAWWVMPLATLLLLTLAIRRAVPETPARASRQPRSKRTR
jgi:membrane protein implicated in regulation of membrane protease activity